MSRRGTLALLGASTRIAFGRFFVACTDNADWCVFDTNAKRSQRRIPVAEGMTMVAAIKDAHDRYVGSEQAGDGEP